MVQLPGDIVLVRGHGRGSDAIVKAQHLVGMGVARFSHAMLCHSPFLFVHSDGQGVHVDTYFELFPVYYCASEMKALRRRDMGDRLARHIELYTDIGNRAQYYFEQAYNAAFIFKRSFGRYDTRSFCSELIAKVYRDVGVPLLAAQPHWVFPVHLQALEEDRDWVDVTQAYVPPFASEFLANTIPTLETLGLGHLGRVIADLQLPDERGMADTIKGVLNTSRQRYCEAMHLFLSTLDLILKVDGLAISVELVGMSQWYWDGLRPSRASLTRRSRRRRKTRRA